MRRAIAVLAGGAALAGCVSTAAPPPALQADALTVSGRHALPKAAASPWAGRVRVAQIVAAPAAARQLGLEPGAYEPFLRGALEKSLRNYGWLAPSGAADAPAITVELPALTAKADAKATAVSAVLKIEPTQASAEADCLRREAPADFRALSPTRSGQGQRAFGMVAGVALAILGGPAGAASAGSFMAGQWSDAGARNAALNARQGAAFGEGVAPTFDKAKELQFAASNAVQLATADYLAHIAKACSGGAAG